MKNLKIRTRISLSLLLPIVGLILFSGYLILGKQQTANEMKSLHELARLAPVISDLVNELQKERGTAAMFIVSKGKKFVKEVPLQYTETDAKREALITALKGFNASDYNTPVAIDPASVEATDAAAADATPAPTTAKSTEEVDELFLLPIAAGNSNTLAERVNVALEALDKIEKMRKKIKRRMVPVLKMAGYYTKTITSLLAVIEEMTVHSTNAKVTTAITAYTSFLQSKERTAIERDMGGTGFAAKKFKYFVHKKFVEIIAQQEAFLETFAVNATDEQQAFLKSTMVGKAVEEVARMRIIATASIQAEFDLQGVKAADWNATITNKIMLLKLVEDKVAKDLIELVSGIQNSAHSAFMTLLAVTGALLAITMLLVITIVRGITGPVASMTGAMSELANGDLSVEVPERGRRDEIGEMSDAVQMFKDNAIRVKQMEAEHAELEKQAESERCSMMLKMADEFENSVSGVVDSVSSASSNMQVSASTLSATAEQTSKQSAAVAAASEEASGNVQTAASAAEELSSSVSEIARQVSQSTQIAGAAVTEVDNANDKVQGLADAVKQIGEVVALITDIADQTNLLALNATIEAARAGDAGKGFAVVASEVKNLANQTARATEQISAQIGSIQGATEEAVTAIGSIGGTITQMNEIASAIAAAVEEQGAATQEIARNVEQAAAGTGEVSSNITSVNVAAGETGQSAEELLTAATDLSQQSESLKSEVTLFLENIRANSVQKEAKADIAA